MDAAQALADLTEISSQIEAAVLFRGDGAVQGSTLAREEATAALVRGALELLEGASRFRSEDGAVVQIEASTPEGSVFVVRDGDRGIVATTAPQPTVGLVFYDLKSCLRGAAAEEPSEPAPEPKKPKRRGASAAAQEEGDAEA
ncbi:MAG: roadblock/LC7 domain-containing protein [Thermoleophilia bacterium]|nr:roadblock/LC7 domain-containing protein [Thermoleophilia bacterium]